MRKSTDILLTAVSIIAGFGVGFFFLAKDVMFRKSNLKTKTNSKVVGKWINGERRVWDVTKTKTKTKTNGSSIRRTIEQLRKDIEDIELPHQKIED